MKKAPIGLGAGQAQLPLLLQITREASRQEVIPQLPGHEAHGHGLPRVLEGHHAGLDDHEALGHDQVLHLRKAKEKRLRSVQKVLLRLIY